jgi:glucose uptake protein GlcU
VHAYSYSYIGILPVRLCSYEGEVSSWGCGLRRRQARNVCHVYLDYAATYVLVSTLPLLAALEFQPRDRNNNNNYNDSNMDNGAIMSSSLIGVAMVGGALLSFGNLSFQWATVVYGAPLTTILALQASLTVLLGTSLNYMLQPSMTPHPAFLLGGVACFLSAIALATAAHLRYTHDRQARARSRSVTASPGGHYSSIELQYGSLNSNSVVRNKEGDGTTAAEGDQDKEQEQKDHRRSVTGLYVALLGGLCFGFFSPAFNIAVNDPFHWSPHAANNDPADPGLLVFYANLWFSVAFGAASIVGNLILLKAELPDVSVAEIIGTYVTHASWTDRRLALLAGLVCATGNVLQFHGGQLVGYATADLVQAYPLVSTLLDMSWFGEFQSVKWCKSRLAFLLVAMYVAYLSGIGLLAMSSLN